MLHLIPVLLILILSGCGIARTLVLEPVKPNNKYKNVTLIADNPNIEVPADVTNKIESIYKKRII